MHGGSRLYPGFVGASWHILSDLSDFRPEKIEGFYPGRKSDVTFTEWPASRRVIFLEAG
jgi:hypothetical protein